MAYRYQTPRSQQYTSSFVPLPLDYLNQAMLSRQEQYDKNYQSAVMAQDKYSMLESVPGGDTDYKTKFLDDSFNKFHQTVKDKYGGDYSQAGNEAMQTVSEINRSPFWNYSQQHLTDWKKKKELYDKYNSAGTLVTPEGFNMNQSVYDAETDSFRIPKYEMYERNDYTKYLNENFKGLQNNIRESGLMGSFDSRNPMLSYQRIKGFSEKEIYNQLNETDINNFKKENSTFMIENPDATSEEVRRFMSNTLGNIMAQEITNEYERNPNFTTDIEWSREQRLRAGDQGDYVPPYEPMLKLLGDKDWSTTKFKDWMKTPDSEFETSYDEKIAEISKDLGLPPMSLADLKKLDATTPTSMGAVFKDLFKINPPKTGEEYAEIRGNINKVKDKLEEYYNDNRPKGIPQYFFDPTSLGAESKNISKVTANEEAAETIVLGYLDQYQISGMSQEDSDKKLAKIGAIAGKKVESYGRTRNRIISPVIKYTDPDTKETTPVRLIPKAESGINNVLLETLSGSGEDFYNTHVEQFKEEMTSKVKEITHDGKDKNLTLQEFGKRFTESYTLPEINKMGRAEFNSRIPFYYEHYKNYEANPQITLGNSNKL